MQIVPVIATIFKEENFLILPVQLFYKRKRKEKKRKTLHYHSLKTHPPIQPRSSKDMYENPEVTLKARTVPTKGKEVTCHQNYLKNHQN